MAILRILTTEVGTSEQVLTLGDQPVRLGRADDNDIVLLEQSASRHHARIEPVDGGYEVIDLGSGGGVQLGGARVTRQRLREGDELVIGGTRLRFVEHPGSERTLLPSAESPASSQNTELGDAPEVPLSSAPTDPSAELGDADTMLPTELGAQGLGAQGLGAQGVTELGQADTGPRATVLATHEPAPPPAAPAPLAIPSATVQAAHQPAPPPGAPALPLEPMEPPKHPSSNASFVMGAGPSSPSDYTLEGTGPGGAASGGYSLDADRGGFVLDTVPPTALHQGPGAGVYILLALIGAGATFGILIALHGVPW